MASLKEHSRTAYTEDKITHDGVRTGSLQRIADAVEIIAKDRAQIIRDVDYYKSRTQKLEGDLQQTNRYLTASKGTGTRYKNQRDEARATVLEQAKEINLLARENLELTEQLSQ
jgi:hypothetical protein